MTLTDDLFTDAHDTQRNCACGNVGSPVWCAPCQEALDADLQRLPHLAGLAARRRDGRLVAGRTGDTERHGKNPFPASQSPAYDELHKTIAAARWFCERLADQLGRRHQHLSAYNNAGLPMDDLVSDCEYLRRFMTPLLVGPLAERFGFWLLDRAAAVERLAGEEMARHPLSAPCPTCDHLSLWRLDGSDRVECGAPGCHLVMTWTEYGAWSAQLAAGGGW